MNGPRRPNWRKMYGHPASTHKGNEVGVSRGKDSFDDKHGMERHAVERRPYWEDPAKIIKDS